MEQDRYIVIVCSRDQLWRISYNMTNLLGSLPAEEYPSSLDEDIEFCLKYSCYVSTGMAEEFDLKTRAIYARLGKIFKNKKVIEKNEYSTIYLKDGSKFNIKSGILVCLGKNARHKKKFDCTATEIETYVSLSCNGFVSCIDYSTVGVAAEFGSFQIYQEENFDLISRWVIENDKLICSDGVMNFDRSNSLYGKAPIISKHTREEVIRYMISCFRKQKNKENLSIRKEFSNL